MIFDFIIGFDELRLLITIRHRQQISVFEDS